jgi:glycosyltransferase involved in cell wall biosynthesis
LHKRSRSFYALLNTYRYLFKIHPYNARVSRLHRAITKVIGRDISTEGPAYFKLMEDKNFFKQDLRFFMKQGGIVLKTPHFIGNRAVEKGALLLKYKESIRLFRNSADLPSVLQHYVLVLEPSWSGFTNPEILYFTQFKDQSIIVMAPEKRDYDFLQTLGTNLIPVNFGSSDWVNPSIFHPFKDQGKRYDAVMVARWGIYKRHHVLFRVLRELRDPSFKVALVADPWPANRKEIEKLIDFYSVHENIDIFENLKAEEVNKIMNQSKINLLLSLQEGGNRSLFEGFFAGVPGLALENNIGIPKDYFTPQTGKLIKEKDLKSELLYFREHWTDFNPRAWAEANITPEITTAKLNEILKRLAYQRGEEWTQDLVAKCNCPNLMYYPNGSFGREMPSYEDILGQYSLLKKESE